MTPPAKPGFTLIELMVAITLLALVLSGVYATIGQVRGAAEAVHSSIDRDDLAAQTNALLQSVLESTLFRPKRPDLAFLGVSAGRAQDAHDQLSLTTSSGMLGPLDGMLGEPVRCRIELELLPGKQTLLSLRLRPSADLRGGGPAFALTSEIQALDLSFLTPDGWSENFDSAQWGGLPSAVRVRAWSHGERIVSRVFPIPLAETYPAKRAEDP